MSNELKKTKDRQRDQYIDILRGIGIFSVVIGHALNTDIFLNLNIEYIRRFFYVYHLSIFFFCTGVFYKQEPFNLFIKKWFCNYYLRYVIIALLSIVMWPFWAFIGFTSDIPIWREVVIKVIKIITFRFDGILVGAMWFVPFIAISLLFYYFISCFFHGKGKGIMLWLVGLMGTLFVHFGILNEYKINMCLVMLPIINLGSCYTWIKDRICLIHGKYVYIVCSLSFLLVFSLNLLSGQEIELDEGKIYGGGIAFYIMTSLGFVFAFLLGLLIINSRMSKIISFFGEISFFIMAFHLMGFRIFDGIYKYLTNNKDPYVSPINFPQFRIVYVFVGLGFSILIYMYLRGFRKFHTRRNYNYENKN